MSEPVTVPQDIVEFCVEIVKQSMLIPDNEVYIDRSNNSKNKEKTFCSISEVASEYMDVNADDEQEGLYRSTISVSIIANDRKKSQLLCKSVTNFLYKSLYDIMAQDEGPIYSVQRKSKNTGELDEAAYSNMTMTQRTLEIVNNFEL
ncbi:MAG: hypothetical protein ACRC2T_12375 [Thermoguttaceae bacterium]